jgi:hypothetical protein
LSMPKSISVKTHVTDWRGCTSADRVDRDEDLQLHPKRRCQDLCNIKHRAHRHQAFSYNDVSIKVSDFHHSLRVVGMHRLHLRHVETQHADRLTTSLLCSSLHSTSQSSQQHFHPSPASCGLQRLQYGLVRRTCSRVQPWLRCMARWPISGDVSQRCSVPLCFSSPAPPSVGGPTLWLS